MIPDERSAEDTRRERASEGASQGGGERDNRNRNRRGRGRRGQRPRQDNDDGNQQQQARQEPGSDRNERGDGNSRAGERDNRGGDNRGGDNRGGDNRGGDNRGGDNRGGDNRGGDNRGGDNRGGDNRGGDNRGGDNRGGDNRGRDNRGGGRRDGGGGRQQQRGNDGGGGQNQKRRNNRNRRSNKPRDQRDDTQNVPEELLERQTGLLELMNEGFGFLRFAQNYFLPNESDVYVPAGLARKYQIRPGSMIEGDVAPARKRGQKPTLHRIISINDRPPEEHSSETLFKNLVACDPYERFRLEDGGEGDISMRIIDLLTPIGKGQRALIVAPPRSGKTVIMQKMANAIIAANPETKVIILLIDERPEEVTDMKRNTKAEVVASCLDEGSANHVRVTELVLEKMRRLVEAGQHVVCLLDSITRLGRAYNNETKHSGRIMSGGVDAKTLAKPKAFFGAARTVENGGSLTIIATALVETGSRMDQVIFEEFKGTGNMELMLSRQLANNRIYPAIDVTMSGTRKEEKLLEPAVLQKVNVLRRVMNQLKPTEAMTLLIDRMQKTANNHEFLAKFDVSS